MLVEHSKLGYVPNWKKYDPLVVFFLIQQVFIQAFIQLIFIVQVPGTFIKYKAFMYWWMSETNSLISKGSHSIQIL